MSAPSDRGAALAATHVWFDRHSGWAPPDDETLAEWLADGVCQCPDECWVAPEEVCAHGLVSWKVVLDDLADHDRRVAWRPASGDGPC